MKAIVEYINHSGFTIETENYVVIIDYVEGILPHFDKPALIVSTHSHRDHFSEKILHLNGENKILLSSDIKDAYDIEPQDNLFYIGPDTKRNIGDFQIETFKSTDAGISIFIYVDNLGIFHAGDLNLWVWEEDSEEERAKMAVEFNAIIKKVQRKNVDIAMFPVDPRLGIYANSGVTYFIDTVKPAHLFPMHMWGDLSTAMELEEQNKYDKTEIHIPQYANEKFEITI